MNIDNSWALHLNHWGVAHPGLTKFLGDDLVYISIVIAVLGFLGHAFFLGGSSTQSRPKIKNLVVDGVMNYVVPMAVAVLISEVISGVINRSRPFVALRGVKLVFPHGADGGMPSHHVLFMISLATCLLPLSRGISLLIVAIALLSGLARIAAGIHYPSDILVGVLLGYSIVKIMQVLKIRFSKSRTRKQTEVQ